MLLEKINQDIKIAIKSGDSFNAGVLRMVIAAFKNKEIEKRGKGQQPELLEEEMIEILMKEVKKRKEADEIYRKAGRQDLADKELREAAVIKNYLPEQASAEEIEKIVIETIEEAGAVSQKDFGRVMALAIKKLKGRAESSLIVELVKKRLEQK